VLDAYMSFATATVRKISLSLSDVTLYHQRYKLKVRRQASQEYLYLDADTQR